MCFSGFVGYDSIIRNNIFAEYMSCTLLRCMLGKERRTSDTPRQTFTRVFLFCTYIGRILFLLNRICISTLVYESVNAANVK